VTELGVPAALNDAVSTDSVFAPVRSQTAFEETVDRLGTAIRLGLLPPGSRLPAERELCGRLGIARSTLRQSLTALAQSGHLVAVRGRGGGTFVAERLPPAEAPGAELVATWHEICDERLAVEVGTAVLAVGRMPPAQLDALGELVAIMDERLEDFPAYRAADVRLHVGIAEATGSQRLVTAITESQGQMSALIAHIAHPPEVLAHSNAQHARLLAAIRDGDVARVVRIMTEHLQGTEHVLAGLLPAADPRR
jgi:DNA-binding FadR family transcriptional regulator